MHAFHHRDFLPIDLVVREKLRRGLSVSLVVPALNEAATIGPIVQTAVTELAGGVGLLDEVVVVDGGSADGTPDIARAAGARVFDAGDIAAGIEVSPGTGTSMWKALFVATGDIIVFADADIRGFGAHFVHGLAAPLILHPDLTWSKAAYRRPLELREGTAEDYGGRVTEIMVRPLLAAFYPELAAVRQPLSGEYAVRADVLRRLTFSSGYGVEILLLLQLYRLHGLSALAEVDMEVRRHRNRPTHELGVMSYAILRAFLRWAQEDGSVTCSRAVSELYSRPSDGSVESVPVAEMMLPPAGSIMRNSWASG